MYGAPCYCGGGQEETNDSESQLILKDWEFSALLLCSCSISEVLGRKPMQEILKIRIPVSLPPFMSEHLARTAVDAKPDQKEEPLETD